MSRDPWSKVVGVYVCVCVFFYSPDLMDIFVIIGIALV